MAAGTLRDAGAVKYLDFRIYFAIIRIALADSFRELIKTQRFKAVAFCHLWAAALCRCPSAQSWGHLGSNWVDIGGRGGGRSEIAKIAMIVRIARIEKQRLNADERGFRGSKKARIWTSFGAILCVFA
jgi:cell division protein FtsW (lipid II flippase)